jgi:hypothetical protein
MTDDEVVARCRSAVGKVVGGTISEADVLRYVEDLISMDPGLAERAGLAAAMVEALTLNAQNVSPELVLHLDDLLLLAGEDPPFAADWPAVRNLARMVGLMNASAFGSPASQDTARRQLTDLQASARDEPRLGPVVDLTRHGFDLMQALQSGNESAMRTAVEGTSAIAGMFGDHPVAGMMSELMKRTPGFFEDIRTGNVAGMKSRLDELGAVLPPQESAFTDAVHQAREQMNRVDHAMRGTTPGTSGSAGETVHDQTMSHLLDAVELFRWGKESDVARVDATIEQCRAAVALGGDQHVHGFALISLAMGLVRRSAVTGDTEGLEEAGDLLDRASAFVDDPHHPQAQLANEIRSMIRHRKSALDEAGDYGSEAQRAFAWRVLLESDPEGARSALRDAARGAVDTARQYVMANSISKAVRALDTGRGLMLFAQAGLRDVPNRLKAAGRPDLALLWETDSRSPSLRRDVLKVLTTPGVQAELLLDPPGIGDIRAALAHVDADAVVYLVPGEGVLPGLAAIAPAAGPPAFLALSQLVMDPDSDVERYLAALGTRELRPVETNEFADRVDRLCDWAWRAAIGPLLEKHFARVIEHREPRIVLIPMGDLARVPWHAARRGDGVHAVQLASFSYAVSARLLCENALRSPVAQTSAGLVVGDPDTGTNALPLRAARVEAQAIRQTHYRSARYVGRGAETGARPSGRGTAAQVREWLADPAPHRGTMLHLACHGTFSRAGGGRAALQLAPDERGGSSGEISADEIIDLMSATPGRRVGLVVMAACHTGRSIHGFDEAYSLGSAFLAGGARSVLSTQWAVPDAATSSLMFLFHHFLRERGLPPRDALRAAQVWMLDPDRVVPASMPAELRALTERQDHAHVLAWAGFIHYGQ